MLLFLLDASDFSEFSFLSEDLEDIGSGNVDLSQAADNEAFVLFHLLIR